MPGQQVREAGGGGAVPEVCLQVEAAPLAQLSTIHPSEAVRQIPQGPGAAPRETGPLLPLAYS